MVFGPEASFAFPGEKIVVAPQRKLGRRPALDGLRGVAILLVLLTHTSLLPNGFMGVDLFFVLSGFLITTFLYEEYGGGGRISLKSFYKKRARRLLPALGLMLLMALAIDLLTYRLTGWPLGVKALTSTLFVNNWLAATGHANDLGSLNPTWSLAQEEQFYLVWPLMLLLFLHWRLKTRWLVGFLVVAIVTLVWLSPSTHQYQIYYSPYTRSAELLFGCLGAVAWHKQFLSKSWSMLKSKSQSLGLWAMAYPLPLASTVALLSLYGLGELLLSPQLPLEEVYLMACALTLPLVLALLTAPEGIVARLLASAPLRYLGKISYSLYLFNLLIRNAVHHYIPQASVDTNALLTMVISVALAAVSWHLVEVRVIRRA